jgi:hypothetical protein
MRQSNIYGGSILGALAQAKAKADRDAEIARQEKIARDKEEEASKGANGGGILGTLSGGITGFLSSGGNPIGAVLGAAGGYGSGRASGASGDQLGAALAGVGSGASAGLGLKASNQKLTMDNLKNFTPLSDAVVLELNKNKAEFDKLIQQGDIIELPGENESVTYLRRVKNPVIDYFSMMNGGKQ